MDNARRTIAPGGRFGNPRYGRLGSLRYENTWFLERLERAVGLVLLDFWAEWCIPCLEIEPVLEKMAIEFNGRVKICMINVEGNAATVAEYVPDNIFPCLVLLRNGEVLDRKYGATPGMEPHAFFRECFLEYLEDSLKPRNTPNTRKL